MGHILPKFLTKGPKFMRKGGFLGVIVTGLLGSIAWGLGSDLYQRVTKGPEEGNADKGEEDELRRR